MTEVFQEIVEMSNRLGVTKINELPGCWEIQVDERWWLAVNGHQQSIACSKGFEVAPFAAYVEFNGWPAGEVTPVGGLLAASSQANEANLIAALKARVR